MAGRRRGSAARGARALLHRLRRDRRGATVVEFALIAPVMVVIALCGFELGRYALLHLKTFNAASTMADLASRDETLTTAVVGDLFSAVAEIVRPFDMAADGRLIVTGVSADVDDDPRVFWQVEGGGGLAAASGVGAMGGTATLPGDFAIRAGETIVVAEVFYRYEPVFAGWMDPFTVRHKAYYRPRLGSLRSIE